MYDLTIIHLKATICNFLVLLKHETDFLLQNEKFFLSIMFLHSILMETIVYILSVTFIVNIFSVCVGRIMYYFCAYYPTPGFGKFF